MRRRKILMNSNLISKAVRYALVASAASAVAAPSAFAADQAATTTASTDTSTAQLGKIEVTGTRIKRTDVETAQPVSIVTQSQIKASGLTSIGEIGRASCRGKSDALGDRRS